MSWTNEQETTPGPRVKEAAATALRVAGSDCGGYVYDELRKKAGTDLDRALSDKRLNKPEMGHKLINLARQHNVCWTREQLRLQKERTARESGLPTTQQSKKGYSEPDRKAAVTMALRAVGCDRPVPLCKAEGQRRMCRHEQNP